MTVLFKMMCMWLNVIFLFPNRCTGTASTANQRWDLSTLRVQIYASLSLVSVPCFTHLGRWDVRASRGSNDGQLTKGVSVYSLYTQMWLCEHQEKAWAASSRNRAGKPEQRVICLFRDWENLRQLLCLHFGSDSQICHPAQDTEPAFSEMWNRLMGMTTWC